MSFHSLLLACCVAGTQALDTVQYGAFLQTATYSVANQLGFFTENGLNVVYDQVASSTAAFQSLLSGQYDILTATVDNSLNLFFNDNEPVRVLGQLDQGPDLALVSVPGITSIEQLKGKPIIVDSPQSGYSILLQDILSSKGLELSNGDYYFMTVGGTPQRFSALVDGALPNGTAVFATMLTYPYTVQGDFLPDGQALNILARVSDMVAPITSSAFTVQESLLSNCSASALVTRFMTSMYAASQFLLNPIYNTCSIAAIAAELGISIEVATSEYASAVDQLVGEVSLFNNFTVNPTGIMNDVMVRQKFGGFPDVAADFNFTAALLPGTGKLIDYSIRDAALAAYNSAPLLGNCTATVSSSTTAAPMPTSTISCNGGTSAPDMSGNYLGLCSFACNRGYCPTDVCVCTSQGTPVTPTYESPAGCPIAGEDGSYSGLCSFCCANGYCPSSSCTTTC